MKDVDKLLKEVLKDITPTKDEMTRDRKVVREVMALLKPYKVTPILVGSLEKGTDLRGNKDIDIFIQFRQSVPREQMEKKALGIGKSVFRKLKGKWEIDYAEHPYVKGSHRGYVVEIVPCYTGKTIMSSVDRTPLHTKYVRKRIRDKPNLSGEIRLLKRFMKAQEVYGAEARVEGFSGYLTEVLVINYGSFMGVLKAAVEWRMPQAIDPEDQWEDSHALKYLFTQASLIVVDPVDKNRNVAAAVRREKLAEFIIAAEEFLKTPSRYFFFPPEIKAKTAKELEALMKSRETRLIALVLKHEKLNENMLYSQLKKTTKSIADEIEENEFEVFKSTYWTNDADTSILLFEMQVWSLPDVKHHPGPPLDVDIANQEKFAEKYRKDKPYIKDGRWVVDTKRRITQARTVLQNLVESKNGFGKNLREAEEIRILEDEKILSIKDEGWHKHLTKILD